MVLRMAHFASREWRGFCTRVLSTAMTTNSGGAGTLHAVNAAWTLHRTGARVRYASGGSGLTEMHTLAAE
jgi:hypothetical protein